MVKINKALDFLQYGVIALMVVFLFQGKGSHSVFLAIALAIPILRYIFSVSFRNRLKLICLSAWNEMECYTQTPNSRPVPWESAFVLVGLPMVLFCLANGVNISSMDNFGTSLVASSFVMEGNTEISEYRKTKATPSDACPPIQPDEYYLRCTPSGVYSAYPVGMLVFAVPFTAISRILGTDVTSGYHQWRLAKWASSCVAGLCLMLFLLIACRISSLKAAFLASLTLLLGSALSGIIGQGLWTQGGVLIGFLIALFCELQQEKETRNFLILIQAFALVLILASRIPGAVLIAPYGLWVLSRSLKRGLLLIGASLLFVCPVLFYFWNVYGNFLGPQILMASSVQSSFLPRLETFKGLIISPVCGLFVYQPWVILLVFLFWPKKDRKEIPTPMKWMLWACIVFHTLIVSVWTGWWSGVYGTRHLSEIIPLLALVLLPVFDALSKRKPAKNFLYSLIFLSALIQAVGLFAYGGKWFYDARIHPGGITDTAKLFDWSDPPFLYPFLHPK